MTIIEPADRRGLYWGGPVGKVLDAAPVWCLFLRGWYSTKKGEVGMRRVKCGRWTCPNCIVDIIVETFGPAWAFWKGHASREVFPNDGAWHNARTRKYSVKMTGPTATPGVVSMPGPDGVTVVVWAPAGVLWGGQNLHGSELDETYRDDIRSIPLAPRVQRPGTDDEDSAVGSFRDDPDLVARVAESVGLDIEISRRDYVTGKGTRDQWTVFRRRLRHPESVHLLPGGESERSGGVVDTRSPRSGPGSGGERSDVSTTTTENVHLSSTEETPEVSPSVESQAVSKGGDELMDDDMTLEATKAADEAEANAERDVLASDSGADRKAETEALAADSAADKAAEQDAVEDFLAKHGDDPVP